jgi:hypothetical protein
MCWELEGSSFHLRVEYHRSSRTLDVFARAMADATVSTDWLYTAGWDRLVRTSEGQKRRVFWSSDASETSPDPRPDLLGAAGLTTRVIVPVPNATPGELYIVLFDFAHRVKEDTQVSDLSTAAFLFGRYVPRISGPGDRFSPQSTSESTHLDPLTRRLVGKAGSVRLSVYEWDMCSVLFERAGSAVSFGDLIQEVWRVPEEHVGRASVYEIITRLRRHFATVGNTEFSITSIPRFGYELRRREP